MLTSSCRTLAALVIVVCCLPASARAPVPTTPDGTIKAAAAAYVEGNLEVLWQAMPASYQADVQKLLAACAKKMDAELWEKGSKAAVKLSKVLTEKTDFVVATPFVAQLLQTAAIKPEDAKPVLTSVAGVLTILQSNAATLPQLEKLDVEKLLVELGPHYRIFFEATLRNAKISQAKTTDFFKNLEVKVVKMEGDRASVEVTKIDDTKLVVEMVRLEGKWVPKEMADQWSAKIDEAHKAIAAFEIKPEYKQQAHKVLDLADSMFEALLTTRTQREFNALSNGSIAAIMEMIAPKANAEPK